LATLSQVEQPSFELVLKFSGISAGGYARTPGTGRGDRSSQAVVQPDSSGCCR
jgi:hypothetical protein